MERTNAWQTRTLKERPGMKMPAPTEAAMPAIAPEVVRVNPTVRGEEYRENPIRPPTPITRIHANERIPLPVLNAHAA